MCAISVTFAYLFCVAPPPARPTAPKPGQPQTSGFDAAIANFPVDMSGLPPAAFHQSMMPSAMPQLSAEPQPLRLKDFLPLMKPGSFGPKAPLTTKGLSGNGSASVPAGSLPGSISASPVHFAPMSGSLPASPHKQMLPNAEPTGAYNRETLNTGFVPPSGSHIGSSIQASQISGAGFKPIMSNQSEVYASFNVQNSNVNMSGHVMDTAGQFVPSAPGSVSTASSVANYSGTSSHVVSSGSGHGGRVDYVYDNASGTSTGITGPMHSTSVIASGGINSMRTLNSQSAGTIQYPTALPHGPSLAGGQQFASSYVAYDNGSGQSFIQSNQGVPQDYNGLHVNPPYGGNSHTNVPVSSSSASGYYSNTPATFPPTYQAISGGVYTGASVGHPPFVNTSSHSISGNNVNQPVNQLQHPSQGLSNMPVPSSASMPRQPPTQTASQFHSPADAQSQRIGITYASAVPTSLPYNSAHQTNSQIQQQMPLSVHQPAILNQATMSGANGLAIAPQNWYSSANQSASVSTFPGQYSHEHPISNNATITSMSGQHQPRFSSDVSVTSVIAASGQPQPRYPSTAAGMPGNFQQQGPGFSSVNQMPQRFPVSNQQPAFQAPSQTSSGYMANNNQLRYPVADRMLPPTAGQSQNDLQRQYPNNVQPEYQMTNVPAIGNTWASPQSVGQPTRGYQTGNQASGEPSYGYQLANQSTGVSQQSYPSGNQQHSNYTYANQAQSQTYSNPGQPAVSGGNFNSSSAYQGSVPGSTPVNYGQMHSSQSFPVQQGVSGVQNVYSAFPQNVSAAPLPYSPATSSVSDITPPSLPSPLQPSRVSSGASSNSKNLESLKDLEITSAANTTASSSSGTSEGRSVSGENVSSVDSTGMASPVGDKLAVPSLVPKVVSTEEQRERREEEARRTLHQSRSTRDPFADADVLTRFAAEVEKFQKLVDALVKPTLGGYLPLDKEWKVCLCRSCLRKTN